MNASICRKSIKKSKMMLYEEFERKVFCEKKENKMSLKRTSKRVAFVCFLTKSIHGVSYIFLLYNQKIFLNTLYLLKTTKL